MKKGIIYIILLVGFFQITRAQDDVDALLNEMLSEESAYTTATFKASRIILGQSVEQPKKGEMELRISHRFGELNGGAHELWGLDQAWIHLSLEFSPISRLTFGLGRSNYQKTYDGYVKYALIKQQSGARNIPVSVSLVGSVEYITIKNEIPDFNWTHRLGYVGQVLIARKFDKNLSLQLSPTLVHRNYVESSAMKNTVYAIGIGGRYKMSKRISLNAEFFWVNDLTGPEGIVNQYPLSIGIDLETGGHVFQIMLTNAVSMREVGFLTETRSKWSDGGIRLGFNLSRMFHLYK
jgi:hypothetical protein